MPYLSVWTDDAGLTKIGRRKNCCRLVHPDVFRFLFVLTGEPLFKSRAELQDEVFDALATADTAAKLAGQEI